MKTKILVLVIVVFFNVSVSFAMYYCIPIAGVYSNADYNGERTVAMIDIHRNCYVNLHRHTASKKYIRIGQLRIGYKEVEEGVRSTRAVIRYRSGIKNKRKDDYWIYMRFKITITDTEGFLETVWSKEYFPDVVSPNDATYRIYYRQE